MFKAFLSFDTFILPGLTKIIYWIGLALIALGTLAALFGAIALSGNPYAPAGGGFFGVIMALVGGAISAVVWRIVVELWMVLFSIYDVLKEIRDQRR
ncbi:DUF4282 domain-containing protein [Devosia honganensis]|uniref:DUF4282 domain-containing protein n=1 Tax=Devosia honganensis TaxID=1610527 RepID=A0ABV7X2S4_9HYPH